MNFQEKIRNIAAEMQAIESKETKTDEDLKRFDELYVEFREAKEKYDKEEARISAITDVEKYLSEPEPQSVKPAIRQEDDNGEFRSLGEFIYTVRFNPGDERLANRALEMKTPESGGYLVPDAYLSEIRMVEAGEAIVRPRATVIPAGDLPDQGVNMPTLDQTGGNAKDLYGGVDVSWITEGAQKVEKNTAFKEVSLDPKEVAGHIVVTDKLLRNAPAVDALVRKLFRGAIIAAEEAEFIAGTNPSTRPTGIISHASTIAVNRATANKITYADIVGMYGKKLAGGNYVYVASVSAIPEIMKMKDFEAADSDAPSLVFQPDARVGITGTLLGIPVLFSDFSPVLGTKGDLLLANFSYYLIKDGYGIAIDASPHVYFTNNKTVIKAFWNVDGKPWLTKPITLRDGSTKVSTFFALDVPATSS